MLQTLYEPIRITQVEIVPEEDGYYCVVSYSDGKFDEFGPYDTFSEAESAVY